MEKERNKINTKLDNLSAPIDKSQLWTAIKSNPQFPGRAKKRRRLFLWLFLLGLMLGGSVMTYWLTRSGGGTERSEAGKSVNKEMVGAEGGDALLEVDEFRNVDIGKEEKGGKNRHEINGADDTQDQFISAANSDFNFSKSNRSIEHSTIEKNKTKSIHSLMNDQVHSIPDKPSSLSKVKNKPLVSESLQNSGMKLLVIMISKNADQLEIQKRDIALSLLENEQSNPKKKLFTLSAKFGSGYAFHSIQPTGMNNINSIDFRNRNTTTLESYFFEVALARQIKWNLDISMGFQYAQHHQRFQHTFLEDISYERNPSNSEDFYTKFASKTEVTYFHRYQLLQLHAAVGKRIAIKNSYLKPSIGAGLNLAAQIKGKYMDESLQTHDLNSSKSYVQNLIPFLHAELLFAYPISPRLELQASTTLNSKIRLTKNNSLFTHHLSTLNANLGLGYIF